MSREEGELQIDLNEQLVRCLLAHLEGLGWSRLQQVSPSFTSFTLQTSTSPNTDRLNNQENKLK
ncbi:hypothetical protein E2C01_078097 [Portunus trituberculatus]|uniref:Uncharacterized protein n=1 Tax=Portunus trituberculatus TaxID=210409 RepID=A0A5B7IRU5_PORTR|nr:hypothetical protein [Portunus trituberculatus]